jgi:diguanylate cyclase (GGDEF)-like protein
MAGFQKNKALMQNMTINVLWIEGGPTQSPQYQEMQRAQQQFGCSLTYCQSLLDGIVKAYQNKIHIIVFDIDAPDHPGLQGLTYFKQQVPDLPIIVLAREEDEDLRKRAIWSGAQDYLQYGHLDATALVLSMRNAIERYSYQIQLSQMTFLDDLTGVYNRRAFMALAQQQMDLAKRNGTSLSVVYVDVDNLKQTNDVLGHHAGDQMIIDLVTVLKRSFRSTDIIARLGGDEFAVVAIETSIHQESVLTSRLRKNINIFNQTEKRPYSLSASIGIATWSPIMAGTLEALIAKADQCMYVEKRSQRKGRIDWEIKQAQFLALQELSL